CDTDNPFGATWGSDDQIYFGQGQKGSLRVSAQGAKREVLVTVKPDELAHRPKVVPGGDVILFTVSRGRGASQCGKTQIMAQSLRTGERHLVVQGGSDARYVPTGHLVYAHGSTILFALEPQSSFLCRYKPNRNSRLENQCHCR